MRTVTEVAWAIRGDWSDGSGRFLYSGHWLTRREAIDAHCTHLGDSWPRCYRRGDRAIRVRVSEIRSSGKRPAGGKK